MVACSSNTPEVEQPKPDELTLEDAIEECERLIGTVNASAAMVQQTNADATAQGKDPFEATAKAHESVVATLREMPYRVPDLQRISGFYIAAQQAQATTYREMGAALARKDEAAFDRASKKLAEQGNQEDQLVEELNQNCRGRAGDAPASSAAPSQQAPSQQPPQPQPQPQR